VLREPTPKLLRYLACTGQAAVLLIPLQATGQQANFEIKANVRVREDSFACKEISELDRLSCRLINAANLPQECNCTNICKVTNASD
jgi:hypothetical protein